MIRNSIFWLLFSLQPYVSLFLLKKIHLKTVFIAERKCRRRLNLGESSHSGM